jgi:hypothetical protein
MQRQDVEKAVEKSLQNLRAMGLDAHVLVESEDRAFVFINLKSVLGVISRRIDYPKHKVVFENPYIVIEVWR